MAVRGLLRRHEALTADVLRHPAPEQALDLLIEFGELESALVDRACPVRDTAFPLGDTLRSVAIGLGHLVHAALSGTAPPRRPPFRRLLQAPLPDTATLRTPEGYAYYGLYPQTYVAAAERFAAEHSAGNAVCLGLRSIGTSLSALVAATLELRGWRVRSDTLRPRGEPFDRQPRVAPALLRHWHRHGGWFLVVDEGPGLSGSSFCGTAAQLIAHGVPESAIVFFPSWDPDGSSLLSPAARDRWPRHRRYHVPFEALFHPARLFAEPLRDVSGGSWRDVIRPVDGRHPAVQPQHERRKYLHPGRAPRLLKFAGLGRFGCGRLERAHILGDAGFVPPPLALRDGFLHSRYLPGTPLAPCTRPDRATLETFASYLAFLRTNFPSDRPVPFTADREMAATNLAEAGPPGWHRLIERLDRLRGPVLDGATIAGDARMLPHEWIRAQGRLYKTDALDHHDDHFFPGCQDLAWDVAGCMIEFGLDDASAAFLLARTARLSGDRDLPRRLPFYRIAYPAWRLGYATLAVRSLGQTPDAQRFRHLVRRYRTALARLPEAT